MENNLVPGINPDELAAAAAAEQTSTQEGNPAAEIANAAMAGAQSVVTTTDLSASDVNPEPTLVQAPEAPAPEAEGPVSITPSADFQMGEVATVSAVQNGADGNLAAQADEVMIGQPVEQPAPAPTPTPEPSTQPDNPMDDPTVDQLANTEMGEQPSGPQVADFNDPEAAAAAEAAAKTSKEESDDDDDPIVAAAPVPGSIGSAKSYADIQRAEAEKAARVAAKQSGKNKLSKNTTILISAAAVFVIGVAITLFLVFGGGTQPQKETPINPGTEDNDHDYSTLSCKRPLAHEEYDSYGANSGTYENIFYFKDDALDGLVTNFSYEYSNLAVARLYRDQFMTNFGLKEERRAGHEGEKKTGEETEEPSIDADAEAEVEDEEETGEKTADQMLKHYVALEDYTVIHGMEIKSEDIEDWLASDAYSDRTYGATEKPEESEEAEEVTRNLEFYKGIQNKIGFTCEITRGY